MVLSLSDSCDPMDYGLSGSSVLGFHRQEYCSGLPLPPPGDLPNSGIKPESPALQAVSCIASRVFTSEPPGKPKNYLSVDLNSFNYIQRLYLVHLNAMLDIYINQKLTWEYKYDLF